MELIVHIFVGTVWANIFWIAIGLIFGKEESFISKENLIVYLITAQLFWRKIHYDTSFHS